jgi:large subunit ribosomal protein L6
MSIIIKETINIPSNISSFINENSLTLTGPIGQLTRIISPSLKISNNNNKIELSSQNIKENKAIINTFKSHINNMIIGITEGYNQKLRITGIGYKVTKDKNNLILSLGYSHDIYYIIPEGVNIELPNSTVIELKSINKEILGKTIRELKNLRKHNPYHPKGIYLLNEIIVIKNTKKK